MGDLSERAAYEARKKLTEGVAWVYVPTTPSVRVQGDGPRQVEFELRQLADDTGALPVFTDPNLLVAQLGEFQPYEKIPVLELLIQVSAAQVRVIVNPVVQEDAERWTANRLDAWRRDNQ
ncbi:hypothetical protein NE236_17460 [Actinoallomurus purpureus]|uniref:hypothetical protein n=1 Tax=Actinoallomurus purpureus TaxID=478114 RepID=UPI00209395A3|nr:hypothetical protein [Actinoallomurus purpureus]MCO6006776.1 hypothetical protein [Actinoallomurus purpureus]